MFHSLSLILFFLSSSTGFHILVQEPVVVDVATTIHWTSDDGDPSIFGLRKRLADNTFRAAIPFVSGASNAQTTFSQIGSYVVEIVSTTPSVSDADTVFAMSDVFSVLPSPSSSRNHSSLRTEGSQAPSASTSSPSTSHSLPTKHSTTTTAHVASLSSDTSLQISAPQTVGMTSARLPTSPSTNANNTISSMQTTATTVFPSPSNPSGLSRIQTITLSCSIGGAVLIAAVAWFLFRYWRKRREQFRESMQPFYMPPRNVQRTPSFVQSCDYDEDINSFNQYTPEQCAQHPSAPHSNTMSQVSVSSNGTGSPPFLVVPARGLGT